MNFLQLQNAVLTDRFGETKRESAKNWINYRYGRLWSAEDWSFKRGVASLTLPNSANSVAMPGFQRILGLWDASVVPYQTLMKAFRPEDFYGEASSVASIPYGFTVIGDTIYFDQAAAGSRTFTVVGELEFTKLVNDGDVPLIPEEFHMTIVSGAIAQGLREENDPTWNAMEADFQAGVEDLKRGYINPVRNFTDAYPSWP